VGCVKRQELKAQLPFQRGWLDETRKWLGLMMDFASVIDGMSPWLENRNA
jgi:hypothetical protein